MKVTRCSRALEEAVFHGTMRRVRGTKRMAMRFTLLERIGRGGLPAPSRRRSSAGGIARASVSRGFGYKQTVRNLAEGSVYSMRVDYRWYDEDGQVVKPGAQALRELPEPGRAAQPAGERSWA